MSTCRVHHVLHHLSVLSVWRASSCICAVLVSATQLELVWKTSSRAGHHPALSRALLELVKRDIKPRDIMTRAAFENAMVRLTLTRCMCPHHHQSQAVETGPTALRHSLRDSLLMLRLPRCSEGVVGHLSRHLLWSTEARFAPGRDHGTGRLDQRGAAPDRHGARRRRGGHPRRLPGMLTPAPVPPAPKS